MTTTEDRGPVLDRRHLNRPGLRSLAWRLDTQPVFLRRMLDRLPREEIADGEHAGDRPLAALTTREPSDPAVALLDAWACVADVLTFYQERIADEGFLRTAGERRSLLELARAVGYELHPGTSASAWLAFRVDDPPGEATVPAGTRVLSIPAQDELPQTFETDRRLPAHATWNRLTPAPPIPGPQAIVAGEPLLLAGTGGGLVRGDVLLLVGGERESRPASDRWCALTVRAVSTDATRGVT
ncbi:MAG: putative baseplate assembly protein, partial [Acidobacteriota bacterium]